MLVRLADWCYRRRRLVVLAWVAALIGAFALAGAFGGEFKQDYLQPGSESQQVSNTLKANFPQKSGDTLQIVVHSEAGVTSAEAEGRVEQILADVAGAEHVVSVASPFTQEGAHQISADGTTAYADVALDKSADQFTAAEAKALVDPILAAGDGTLQVEAGGPVATKSLTVAAGSEGIGLIAAAIILLITFGSVVAMGLPLITALFGLGIAMALGEVLQALRRRPGVGSLHRGDGRHRRRHRLRPVDRHPVPQQPGRWTGPPQGHADRHGDRRPRGALRRH